MGSFGGFLVLKLVELKLILVLYDTYGAAPTWFARWMIFRDQPELAQIGTITSVVAIVAIIAVTFRRIVREIRRWLRPSSGYRENGEFAPGD